MFKRWYNCIYSHLEFDTLTLYKEIIEKEGIISVHAVIGKRLHSDYKFKLNIDGYNKAVKQALYNQLDSLNILNILALK